jgi:hypothetical protein
MVKTLEPPKAGINLEPDETAQYLARWSPVGLVLSLIFLILPLVLLGLHSINIGEFGFGYSLILIGSFFGFGTFISFRHKRVFVTSSRILIVKDKEWKNVTSVPLDKLDHVEAGASSVTIRAGTAMNSHVAPRG